VTALARCDRRKAQAWSDIIKIGRTHMQDATPLTLGQEWSGYAGMLADDLERIEAALARGLPPGARRHRGRHRHQFRAGFRRGRRRRDRQAHGLAVSVTAPNKFAVQGAHDALVQLSGTLRTLAVSLYKIANDIRLMSCGPARRICGTGDSGE
jgi:fumarate hydratase class II